MSAAARQPMRGLPVLALLIVAAGFVVLGIWQVERRAWKQALIAAVDSRIRADPVAAPALETTIRAETDAYRRVRATGHFRPRSDALVRAVSDLGSGYWVLTPLDTGRFVVLVNRGFILPEQSAALPPASTGLVTVTGLLRLSEPGGGFLRSNDPAAGNWYSRDVAAIAQSRGLHRVAPYFIDADTAGNAPGAPVGGLTVVRFADNHAVYALTWFALALLSIGAAWFIVGRPGYRRRHKPSPSMPSPA